MPPIRILLSEDDADDQLFFTLALAATGVKSDLVIAADGQKLMDILGGTEKIPDLIFLDINMPLKNGLECLMEIRHDKRLSTIPVIILSTAIQKKTVNLTYELGANMYLGKPTELERLTAMLQEVLAFEWATIPRFSPENFARF